MQDLKYKIVFMPEDTERKNKTKTRKHRARAKKCLYTPNISAVVNECSLASKQLEQGVTYSH